MNMKICIWVLHLQSPSRNISKLVSKLSRLPCRKPSGDLDAKKNNAGAGFVDEVRAYLVVGHFSGSYKIAACFVD